jgi:nucleoside 2-deoxyribosyltransferase
MKFYFACSITGRREFEGVYQVIVEALGRQGHEVLNGHLAESGVGAREAVLSPREVYARDVAWIRECDALIAEVSVPSHGVGYEIGFALEIGKPVLVLHQHGRQVSKRVSEKSKSPHPIMSF